MKSILFIILTIASSTIFAGECSLTIYADRFTPWGEKINNSPEIYSQQSIETDGTGCMKSAIEQRKETLEKFKAQDINFARAEYHHLLVTFKSSEESIKAKIK